MCSNRGTPNSAIACRRIIVINYWGYWYLNLSGYYLSHPKFTSVYNDTESGIATLPVCTTAAIRVVNNTPITLTVLDIVLLSKLTLCSCHFLVRVLKHVHLTEYVVVFEYVVALRYFGHTLL